MVSSFLTLPGNNARILLLKRSPTASPFPSLWAACSGRIEEADASPQSAALREIYEETSISKHHLDLLKAGAPFEVSGGGKAWTVWSFLWKLRSTSEESRQGEFEGLQYLVKLNEENVEARWVTWEEMAGMQTVPDLARTVGRLLGKDVASAPLAET